MEEIRFYNREGNNTFNQFSIEYDPNISLDTILIQKEEELTEENWKKKD